MAISMRRRNLRVNLTKNDVVKHGILKTHLNSNGNLSRPIMADGKIIYTPFQLSITHASRHEKLIRQIDQRLLILSGLQLRNAIKESSNA